MIMLKCVCGACKICREREKSRRKRLYQKILKQAESHKRTTSVKRGPPLPLSHTGALKFNPKKRPYDPADALAHIFAVFRECPTEDKPQLLARIKTMVRDLDPTWGGFKFQ